MSLEKPALPDTAFDPLDEEEAGSLKPSETGEKEKAMLQAAAKNSAASRKT